MDIIHEACQLSCERWISKFEQDNDEKHVFSKHHQRAMHNICNKIKYPNLSRRILIAIAVAITTLLITTSVFALVRYKEYIIEKFDTYSIYSTFSDSDTKDIDDLNITYIPDDFRIKEETSSDLFQQTMYSKDDLYFSVKKYKIGTDINFDTEEYNFQELELEGIKYIVYSSSKDTTGIIWNNGEYQFQVLGNIEQEEIINIAISIK